MDGAKPILSPCSVGSKLSSYERDPLPIDQVTEFRQIVCALQYCTLTRLDISFVVNQLRQVMHSLTSIHMMAAKRVIRYLKGTLDHGLWYSPGSLSLRAFCDADWAGSPDDHRSTSGYTMYLGNCLVSWLAKKQFLESKSSTEAEYKSLTITTAQLYWLRMLKRDLQISLPSAPVLWCDNVSAIALASIFHAHTKHIEVDYHFIRKKVLNKDICVKIDDIFTKCLSSPRFAALRDKLLVLLPLIRLREGVSNVDNSRRSSQHACEDSNGENIQTK